MHLQANEHLRVPEAGRGKEGSPTKGFRENMALYFQPTDSERVNFYCVKRLNLWLFVTAVMGIKEHHLKAGKTSVRSRRILNSTKINT